MKKIINIISILLITLVSCNDAFLERPPLDEITDANYWQTELHVKNAANACYPALIGKDVINMDCMGDNVAWYTVSSWRTIGSGNYGSSLGTLNSTWVDRYLYIRRCNYFLENYNRADNVPSVVREKYAAEVKFIRAHQYWLLLSFYGDIPFVTKTLTMDSPELFAPRTDKYASIDWILEDLENSYANLPLFIEPASANFGRISQAASLALKARIALQFADADHPKYYKIAEVAAERVIAMGKHSIYKTGAPTEDYQNLFIFKGRASRNAENKETILAYVYNYDNNSSSKTYHNLSRECHVPDQEVRFQPTKAFCDSYLCTDGKSFGNGINDSSLSDSTSYTNYFNNRDPRMKQSILYPGYTPYYGGFDGDHESANTTFHTPRFNNDKKGAISQTGFYCLKYVEPTKVPLYNTDDNDIILIRYAEVLLIYAEAMLEQGKLTQAIVDNTINKLRDRVGMIHLNLADLPARGQDIRTELRRERRVELFMEGFRWFDIVRWKEGYRLGQPIKGIKKSWVHSAQASYVASYKVDTYNSFIYDEDRTFIAPKNYLWCLPRTQIERNQNLFPNNPGWE